MMFGTWQNVCPVTSKSIFNYIFIVFLVVRKKLEKISKRKDCEIIAEWMKSIINHLYWCALSTEDGNSAMIEAKWLSIINHIHNIHHGHNDLFPKCAHEHIYRRNKKWLKPRKYYIILIIFIIIIIVRF